MNELHVLFSPEMPLLSSLELVIESDQNPNSRDFADVLLRLGARAENLREFRFYGSSQDKSTLEALARNAPELDTIRLFFDDKHNWQDVSVS